MACVAATTANWSAVRLVNPVSITQCGNGTPERSGRYSQGLGWIGAAVGRCGLDLLKQRRKQSSAARAAVGVGKADEEFYPVGDFCPLYSELKSVAVSSSSKREGRSLRRLETRSSATSVGGGVVVKPANTLITEEDEKFTCEFPSYEVLPRIGSVSRVTKETSVEVELNLDGTGICDCDTGIPFLDHMLDQLASHGLLDVTVKAKGDIYIDDHHTNEDIGLALGTALLQALGDRKGIYRFGDFSAPLDEALIHVALDLSGRPFLGYNVDIPTQRVGTYDTQLVEHFFQSVVNTSGMTLHVRKLAGTNSHHIIEATFKAFARALRQALEYDTRRRGSVPSSKGVLSRA